MTLSMSRVVSTDSNSGLSGPATPTRASTAVPPRAGLGTVATGWHPPSAITAAIAAMRNRLPVMGFQVDVGDRADQEGHDQDPGRPVDLALQAAAGAVTAAQPAVPATDGPTQPRRLWRLSEDASHQTDRDHGLDHDQGVLDPSQGASYLSWSTRLRTVSGSRPS